MIATIDHKITSSFLEWFEYTLLQKGQAYKNIETDLYPMQDARINSMDTFSAPCYQWVHDQCISGAVVPTASELGVPHLDYRNGRTIGGAPSGPVQYAIKDFNIYLTTLPEEALVLENKPNFRANPYYIEPKGLEADQIIAPCIFIRPKMRKSEPLCLGGLNSQIYNFDAIIFSDDEWSLHGVGSIFLEHKDAVFPFFDETPLNYFNDYKTGGYCYEHQCEIYNQAERHLWVEDVSFSTIESDSFNENIPRAFLGKLYFRIIHDRANNNSFN